MCDHYRSVEATGELASDTSGDDHRKKSRALAMYDCIKEHGFFFVLFQFQNSFLNFLSSYGYEYH